MWMEAGWRHKEKMLNLTSQSFETEVLKSNMFVLVDFWAPWCGPCQIAAPVIEEIAKEYEGKIKVGKVNIDENPTLAQKYGIMSIPTFLLFQNGQEVKREVEFTGKEGIIKLISNI